MTTFRGQEWPGLERVARSIRRRAFGGASLLVLLSLAFPSDLLHAQADIPPASEVLGIRVGADSVLADWAQIGRYMATLATASDHVRLDTIGRTTLDRPLLLVTITAPDHLQRLDEIKRHQALLADPRLLTPELEDSLLRSMPAVILINNNLHSTEIGSSLFSMTLAHRLATDHEYRELLKHLVILMVPSANPDGLDMVVSWYRQHLGTRYDGTSMPWLYHHYVGHDNNRDWYMFTQVESRAIARVLYREWFPEIVWDAHQMGNRGARIFLPPFSDPVNPNLDPMIVEATNLVGTAMATALHDADKTGIQHQASFDLWWHGGFRSVPARHNMVGILSEVASARLASPIYQDPDSLRAESHGVNYPDPWRGGAWSLGDIIEYEMIAADGLIRLVAGQHEHFIRRFVSAGRRAVAAGEAGDPFAYLIPLSQHDRWAAAVLTNALLEGGIEILRATRSFVADGTTYPAGTLVIPMAQPFRAHVKDLLEIQHYPDRRQYPGGPPETPYDVAGWTLPLQMGLNVPRIDRVFEVHAERLTEPSVLPGAVHGTGDQWVLTNRSNMESHTIAEALGNGARLWLTQEPMTIQGTALPPGSVVLEDADDPRMLARLIEGRVRAFGFDAWATTGLRAPRAVQEGLPRIGLYKPWTGSMDEGWTRWVLEEYGIPYVSVTDSMIRAGDLGRTLDVLLLPDLDERGIVRGRSAAEVPEQYAGGMTETGAAHVATFVRSGGVLVTLNGSSAFAISQLGLPVRNTIAFERGAAAVDRFYAPGSVFETRVDLASPVTSGGREITHVYYSRGAAFEVEQPARALLWYVDAPLRSGYALNQQQIGGKAALVDTPAGRGRAILFGFSPQFRGQPHGTFKLLFNALLLSGID